MLDVFTVAKSSRQESCGFSRLCISPETTLFLSYEYADHERFIDRGIPTIDGSPDESLSDIVFGNSSANLQTLEATIMRHLQQTPKSPALPPAQHQQPSTVSLQNNLPNNYHPPQLK